MTVMDPGRFIEPDDVTGEFHGLVSRLPNPEGFEPLDSLSESSRRTLKALRNGSSWPVRDDLTGMIKNRVVVLECLLSTVIEGPPGAQQRFVAGVDRDLRALRTLATELGLDS